MRYNLLCSVAFTIEADTNDIDQIPAADLLVALRHRVADLERELRRDGTLEAFEDLGDTYEVRG